MQVDALAVALRPRSMNEAIDLGVRLVQQNAPSIWRSFTPLYLVVAMIALSTVSIASWMPTLVIFCLKPWLDRSLLFVLSRAVFGQTTQAGDLWRARQQLGLRHLPAAITLRRLSPWRAITQPIYELEGQSFGEARKRRAQLMQGKRGAALGMHTVFVHIEAFLVFGLFALLIWLAPDDQRRTLFSAWSSGESTGMALTSAALYAGVVLLLEPFYVAAGFAMYLNRRVELEAWDIEQEFRGAFAH